MRVFSFLLFFLKWINSLFKIEKKRLSYCQSTKIFCRAMKRIIPDNRHNSSFEKNLREKQLKLAETRTYGVKVAANKKNNRSCYSEFSTFLKIIKSKEQNFFTVNYFYPIIRLTVKIFPPLRLPTKFWAVLRLIEKSVFACNLYTTTW